MQPNNHILNQLFTQNIFFDLLSSGNNATYTEVIRRYVNDPEDMKNGELISEIYSIMSHAYRNEYFYLNTILNKLLLGIHKPNTTTALTQIPINCSIADFILINGRAVVYEIKTELDTFDRLETQIADYYKAFSRVCVVTSQKQYPYISSILQNSPVGIYILSKDATISRRLRKEPEENISGLDHIAMFKVLHKREYENVLLNFFGSLPEATPAFYFTECMKQFSTIPIQKANSLMVDELKKRNRITYEKLTRIPYELRSLMYFSKPTESRLIALDDFLENKYGG